MLMDMYTAYNTLIDMMMSMFCLYSLYGLCRSQRLQWLGHSMRKRKAPCISRTRAPCCTSTPSWRSRTCSSSRMPRSPRRPSRSCVPSSGQPLQPSVHTWFLYVLIVVQFEHLHKHFIYTAFLWSAQQCNVQKCCPDGRLCFRHAALDCSAPSILGLVQCIRHQTV